MSATFRRNLRSREEFEYQRGWTDDEMKAAELRKEFLKEYIINFDTNLYKTVVERDWGYIAKREYRWDVEYKALTNGMFAGNVAWSLRMFMLKKFVIWPLPVVGVLGYLYYQPLLLQKHNKKLFDMCNVGEQYHLGKKRNEVLRECNKILNREDF
mmetsp:Transcript_13517/g.15479  ORF Transcript_13517/g.15479 Transcript_13517/m.15479 type:complete len:155 (+) Transcript_13517:30-494(+)|eukprot:CAMPEP_0176450376 /NCGR_PEP_ID=MMETSP0127-20121128/27108_1 /TAXON_ID=938130 /ORGANISM="Platyophrya macrostoma, Strain WH" /LENGTH=154 /DNA_ID=CAMNT_0017838037 /DNA_START=22 /DNA_END=486 /DNA_ORIENTATION=-